MRYSAAMRQALAAGIVASFLGPSFAACSGDDAGQTSSGSDAGGDAATDAAAPDSGRTGAVDGAGGGDARDATRDAAAAVDTGGGSTADGLAAEGAASDATTVDGGQSESGNGTSTQDASMDACAFPTGWPVVTPTESTGSPPAQSGGTLLSGTYYLTAQVFYESGCAGETLSIELVVNADPSGTSGSMIEVSKATAGSSTASHCIPGTYQTNGSSIVQTSHTTMTDSYTATPTSLTLVQGGADAGTCNFTMFTYMKQ